jgi:hypothetical protein
VWGAGGRYLREIENYIYISYCGQWAGLAQYYSAGLRAEWSRIWVTVGAGNFLFTTTSRPALGPTQPPIEWVPGAHSLGVKRPGHEADHSPPSSAEVKERVEPSSTSRYSFVAWCSVKKRHRNNFTFTFYLSVANFNLRLTFVCSGGRRQGMV